MITNIKFNSLLLLSIPLLLITGPFLSDLVIVIFFFSATYLYVKNKILIKKNMKKFIYFFFIFYFISVLSSVFSFDKYISLKSSVPYVRYLGLVLIGYYLYNLNKNLIEKLGLVVVFIFIILFIDSVLFFLFGFNISGDQMLGNRFSSFFGDEKVLGGYVARLNPLGLIFISSIKKEKNKKYLFTLYILLVGYLILLSGERTAFLILIAELLIIILFFPKLRKNLLTIFVITLISVLSIIYFLPSGKLTKPFERIIIHSLGQIYFNNQKLVFFSERHEDHYKTAINIFKKNFLLGGGNKSFRNLCSMDEYTVKEDVEKRYTTYAQHEDYLLILEDRNVVDLEDIFILYYKNQNKPHTETVFNIKKFKDFFQNDLYKTELRYFDGKKISDKNYLNLNGVYVKKNEKLFLYDGQINFSDGCNTHPHHIYLQVASENGIINLLIIIVLFVYIIVQLIDIYKKKYQNKINNKDVFLLIMIFIQILPFLPSGNFYNNWLSIFFFLPIGFYFALKDDVK